MNESSDANSTSLAYNPNFTIFINDSILQTFYHKNFIVMGLYIPVFILGLIANSMVITVVFKYHDMRSVTNYFLVNLSAADLLVTLVCMPNGAWQAYTRLWHFGEVACKVSKYLQCVAVAASVFTITAMALDRYMAITKPFGFWRCICFNKKTAIVIIMLLWIASMTIFAPTLFVCKTQVDHLLPITFCYEDWEKVGRYYPRHIFGIVCFVVMFAIPGVLMLWAYSMMGRKLCSVRPPFDNNEGSVSTQQSYRLVKERKRVAWILLLLAFMFAVCWLPYNTINLFIDTTGDNNVGPTVQQYMLLLGHANSALNPLIYCIMSRNFRRSVKDLVCKSRVKQDARRNNRLKWADSSGSSQRLYQLQKFYTPPVIHNYLHHTLSRQQSSQKTTKTCAV